MAGFIDLEFELARRMFEAGAASVSEGMIHRAEQFYRGVVERLERENGTTLSFRLG
ncbi:hypothetical protein ACU4GH_28800 [Bradyrhizobium betae]